MAAVGLSHLNRWEKKFSPEFSEKKKKNLLGQAFHLVVLVLNFIMI
jgi:hypothetical protein